MTERAREFVYGLYGSSVSSDILAGKFVAFAASEVARERERWQDWRGALLNAWAKDYRATMTALLEGGPVRALEVKS